MPSRCLHLPCVALVFSLCGFLQSSQAETYRDLIPRHLIGLVHAPEVHHELGFSEQQVTALEQWFLENDSRWFASRNLSAEEQSAVLDDLESSLWHWMDEHTDAEVKRRLKQLEFYAQGTRGLLRDDIARSLKISDVNRAAIADLSRATAKAQTALQGTKFGDETIPKLQQEVRQATSAESAGLEKHLTTQQRQRLSEILGASFDPSGLQRIYAMAPEFRSDVQWLNTPPLTMRQLRGKVVLVHFYAFQCHNCHANFPIYRRWHKELADKGVVVVGIQTPETSSEREPERVEAAAVKHELDFPIAMDLDSSHWAAWGNTMWPTVYVVDSDGYIRFWWSGELNWKGATADKQIEEIVDDLLASKASS